MTERQPLPYPGAFVAPTGIRDLLHAAESEYLQIRGSAHVDDTLDIVDERLRAEAEFIQRPSSPYMNYLDLFNYMSRRTGLPIILCAYYALVMSESAGAITWPDRFDPEEAEAQKERTLQIDFATSVVSAVLAAWTHPNEQWREFNQTLIEATIDHEDGRRLKVARALYDAINARDE